MYTIFLQENLILYQKKLFSRVVVEIKYTPLMWRRSYYFELTFGIFNKFADLATPFLPLYKSNMLKNVWVLSSLSIFSCSWNFRYRTTCWITVSISFEAAELQTWHCFSLNNAFPRTFFSCIQGYELILTRVFPWNEINKYSCVYQWRSNLHTQEMRQNMKLKYSD